MNSEEKLERIKNEAKKTIKQLKELHKDKGTYDKPVDIDMVKTTKAMFYENVLEILKNK